MGYTEGGVEDCPTAYLPPKQENMGPFLTRSGTAQPNPYYQNKKLSTLFWFAPTALKRLGHDFFFCPSLFAPTSKHVSNHHASP